MCINLLQKQIPVTQMLLFNTFVIIIAFMFDKKISRNNIKQIYYLKNNMCASYSK